MYIKCQNKVIKVINLEVFEDNKAKVFTDLLNYKNVIIFQGFFLANKNKTPNSKDYTVYTYQTKALISIFRADRKVKSMSKAKVVDNTTIYYLSQKIKDLEREK